MSRIDLSFVNLEHGCRVDGVTETYLSKGNGAIADVWLDDELQMVFYRTKKGAFRCTPITNVRDADVVETLPGVSMRKVDKPEPRATKG